MPSVRSASTSCLSVLEDPSPRATILEYVKGLPSTFEGDPAPCIDDDATRLRSRLSGLSREGLKQQALDYASRCSELLDELLDQELLLGRENGEVRTLRALMVEREEEIEVLRAQLQDADNYSEVLLSEKADALRKLTEAKNELADLSAKAAGLQRTLAAQVRREGSATGKGLTSVSLASTPRTTAAEKPFGCAVKEAGSSPKHRSVHDVPAENRECFRDISQPKPLPHVELNGMRSHPHFSLFNVSSTLSQSQAIPIRNGAPRQRETISSSHPGGALSCNEDKAQDSPTERNERHRLYFESRRRNEVLLKGLGKMHTDRREPSAGAAHPSPKKKRVHYQKSHKSVPQIVQEKVECLEKELSKERERNRKQSRLEVQLLREIACLARKLRAHEQTKKTVHPQCDADSHLTRDQLLDELLRARREVSALTHKLDEVTASSRAGDVTLEPSDGETIMMEELADALEEALAENEVLQAEKECLLSEKHMREVLYEMELRTRVAEVERLTSVMNGLRDQVSYLRGIGSLVEPTPVVSHRTRNSRGTRQRSPVGVAAKTMVNETPLGMQGKILGPCNGARSSRGSSMRKLSVSRRGKEKLSVPATRYVVQQLR
ncbi:hypothetical protein ERJ75_001433100 [Trypanosoma vivax]|uniref:Uncharacterized protein n=1 Tax=Trypanosoma vivax (strain Y486) TaxID=1055687 RepID=G0TTK8_TRYVY|nr:hypothetical protein TRVL_03571 [Trypanosoma vivax]KAH8607077.1 hypothetical protein ERJ75_001433100 [Trypanosoma vivax]CCC47289.1 conserved hypothetical protein [Trypanosoma vivax Y486]